MPKLLIADDEQGVRSLVRMTLEDEGVEIYEAADGTQALEMARSIVPDMILLDVMMPGLTGIEVCREVKMDPALRNLTVVMLTAKAQHHDRERGFEAGADDYFTKPFSPVALLTKVDEVLAPVRR